MIENLKIVCVGTPLYKVSGLLGISLRFLLGNIQSESFYFVLWNSDWRKYGGERVFILLSIFRLLIFCETFFVKVKGSKVLG